MKFWEAVEVARKMGKKISFKQGVAEWSSTRNALVWIRSSDQVVFLDDVVLDADWQVIEPPPKEYDFAEAYQMMKAGRWMKPVYSACPRTYQDKTWWRRAMGEMRIDNNLPLGYIDSKWVEA